jgi:Ca2+-binding RTX toxin-like protein
VIINLTRGVLLTMALIDGTQNNDVLQSSAKNLDGDGDFIRGFEGNDYIISGPARDTINGNQGDDTLFGLGNSSVLGGEGNDLIIAGDLIYDVKGTDRLIWGNVTLSGEGRINLLPIFPSDYIVETTSKQSFFLFDDTLNGNKGNDTLIGSRRGGSLMFGGQGNDIIYAQTSEVGETMFGDLGDDILFGDGNSTLVGGGFASDIGVNDGNDTLVGGFDNQLMFGGSGVDTYLFKRPSFRDITVRNPLGQTFVLTTVVEGGYGGFDIIRGYESGERILLTELARNDRIRIVSDPAGTVILLDGSQSGSELFNTILVEGFSPNQLLSSGVIQVNGVALTLSNVSPSANLFSYLVP